MNQSSDSDTLVKFIHRDAIADAGYLESIARRVINIRNVNGDLVNIDVYHGDETCCKTERYATTRERLYEAMIRLETPEERDNFAARTAEYGLRTPEVRPLRPGETRTIIAPDGSMIETKDISVLVNERNFSIDNLNVSANVRKRWARLIKQAKATLPSSANGLEILDKVKALDATIYAKIMRLQVAMYSHLP